MDTDLKRFEEELERLSPGKLPEGLIARMELAMEGWEDAAAGVEDRGETEERDKVVQFPGTRDAGGVQVDAQRQNGAGRSWWAAAAAVAVLGALVGLFFADGPGRAKGEDPVAGTPERLTPGLQPVDYAPQAARRKILGASEQNMVLANGEQPLRVMRLDYVDRVVFRNGRGEEVHVEVPTVNYRLIPVVTD